MTESEVDYILMWLPGNKNLYWCNTNKNCADGTPTRNVLMQCQQEMFWWNSSKKCIDAVTISDILVRCHTKYLTSLYVSSVYVKLLNKISLISKHFLIKMCDINVAAIGSVWLEFYFLCNQYAYGLKTQVNYTVRTFIYFIDLLISKNWIDIHPSANKTQQAWDLFHKWFISGYWYHVSNITRDLSIEISISYSYCSLFELLILTDLHLISHPAGYIMKGHGSAVCWVEWGPHWVISLPDILML